MAAATDWQAYIIGADEDPNTTAYATIARATVAAYTGAAFVQHYIYRVQELWDIKGEPKRSVSGWSASYPTGRKTYTIPLLPYQYESGAGDQDIDDRNALYAVLVKPFLWIGLYGGSRKYPSTISTIAPTAPDVVMPVLVTKIDQSVEPGYHKLTIDFEHRGIQ